MMRNKLCYIIVLWLMLLYGVIHKNIEAFVYENFSGIIDVLVEAFNKSSLLTWATCLLLLGATLYLSCCKENDRHYSWSKLILEVFTIEVLWFIGAESPKLFSVFLFLPLSHFFAILIFAVVVADIVRVVEKVRIQREFSGKSFTIDDDVPQNIDSVRAKYAEDLLERFRNTENGSDSSAIIIYGAWGSGKTVFLHHIQQKLEDNHEEVLVFNPWSSQSPQQVVSDFFDLLAESLKRYDSSLEKPILKYSELLETIDPPKLVGYVTGLIGEQEDGSNDLKEQIVEALQRIKIPFYVLIDDMDRMNGEEILAVLRLIRNTANFPYLKFIVTCDKAYLKERLDGLHVNLAYVEKIFMAEFYLPEIYALTPFVDACKKDVQAMTDDVQIPNFLGNLYNTKLVEEALGSMRQAKKFARELVLDWEFCKENKIGKQDEIIFSDYFWIELLKYTCSEVYQGLMNNPDNYLAIKKNNRHNVKMYVLKSDAGHPVTEDKLALKILEEVFSSSDNPNKNLTRSVVLMENFDKYFSFGKAVGHVTIAEYSAMLYKQENSENLIQKIANMDSNLIASLQNLVKMTNGDKLRTIEAKKRYIDIFFAVGCRYKQSEITRMMEDKFIPFLKQSSTEEALKVYLSEKLKQEYRSDNEIFMVNVVCNKLLSEIRKSNSHILDLEKEELENVMKQQFKSYLSHSQHDAADIFKERSWLRRILEASVVCIPITDDNFEFNECDCVVFDELMAHFSAHKSHNIEAIHDFETLYISDENNQGEARNAQENKYEEKLFGSQANYERFKQKCFE